MYAALSSSDHRPVSLVQTDTRYKTEMGPCRCGCRFRKVSYNLEVLFQLYLIL